METKAILVIIFLMMVFLIMMTILFIKLLSFIKGILTIPTGSRKGWKGAVKISFDICDKNTPLENETLDTHERKMLD